MDPSTMLIMNLILFEVILPIISLCIIAYINMEYIRIMLFISCSTWIIVNLENVISKTFNYLTTFPFNQAMFGPPRETFD